MRKTLCPNCDAVMTMDRPQRGAVVRCDECDVQLVIIGVSPFEVCFPFYYCDEDWDEEGVEEEYWEPVVSVMRA